MTNIEGESGEPTELDLLVDRSIELFRTYQFHPQATPELTAETPFPYLIHEAVIDAVDEILKAGKSALDIALEFRKLRPDYPLSQEVYILASIEAWDQTYREIVISITDREIRTRSEEVRRMNKRRIKDYLGM